MQCSMMVRRRCVHADADPLDLMVKSSSFSSTSNPQSVDVNHNGLLIL